MLYLKAFKGLWKAVANIPFLFWKERYNQRKQVTQSSS